jgi:hypothetical protein
MQTEAAMIRHGSGGRREGVGQEAAKGGIGYRPHALRPSRGTLFLLLAATERREGDEGVALGLCEEVLDRRGEERHEVVHQPLHHKRRRGGRGELVLVLVMAAAAAAAAGRLAHDVAKGERTTAAVGRQLLDSPFVGSDAAGRTRGEAECCVAKGIGALLEEVVQYLLLLAVGPAAFSAAAAALLFHREGE